MISVEAYYLPKVGVERDAVVGLSATMLIVAYPSSLLIFIFGALLGKLFGDNLPSGPIVDFLVWQSFLVVGYVQWFVLLPRAIAKMKKVESRLVWGIVLMAVCGSLYWLYSFLFPPLSGN